MRVLAAAEPAASERIATVGFGGELTLPDHVLRELRLLRPEPFLVFSEGRQFVHMIRADAGSGVLLKAERISLQGNLESFGIADLFSLLNMSRRSGLLLLLAEQAQKSVYFRRGEIVFAGSNLPRGPAGAGAVPHRQAFAGGAGGSRAPCDAGSALRVESTAGAAALG